MNVDIEYPQLSVCYASFHIFQNGNNKNTGIYEILSCPLNRPYTKHHLMLLGILVLFS